MGNRLEKREKHAELEHELRVLERRRSELWKDLYITIDLEKPLFVGYEKFFIFRTDILSRPDFPILEKLLPLVNTVLSSKNKQFTKRARRKTRQANKEKGKKTIDIEHKTKDLKLRDWEKLSVKEQAYFYPVEIKAAYSGKLTTVYRWHFPWMLVSRIRKSYVTTLRIKNPDIESERANIDNYIERRNLDGKIGRLVYGRHKYRYYNTSDQRYRMREKEVWKEIHKDLDFLPPSVKTPFDAIYPLKTIKPKHSQQNTSALLFYYPLSIIHYPLSIIHYPLKIISCIKTNKPIVSRPISAV
jgi:hypothetical protein